MRLDSARSPAFSPMVMVRHGVLKGRVRTTGAPLLDGVSVARRMSPSPRARFMPA